MTDQINNKLIMTPIMKYSILPPERNEWQRQYQTSKMDCLIKSNDHKEPMAFALLPKVAGCSGTDEVSCCMEDKVSECILESKHQKWQRITSDVSVQPLV